MKIILLGDSITQGLGSKKYNFTQELEKKLGEDDIVMNFAMTGTTISYAIEIMENILIENPDFVIIVYGSVDAQIRPNRDGYIFGRLPSRYKINGGSALYPRPFYSKSIKKVGQLIDNFFRYLFRNIIYKIDGTEQWMPLSDFVLKYKSVCKILLENNINIITSSTIYIDEKLFPGSNLEYIKYNAEIEEISKNSNLKYIDLYSVFMQTVEEKGWGYCYNKDHFHPNEEGYKVIAEIYADALKSIS